ncbi:hypothetical protein EV702DRAFT_1050866 [Suillus placidus]|uniref:Uncharacterized protein n=1 Tax=Suillus placidus TaxID=48579 RepID=A0A9P6ZHW5_9AGAM|nr:hypothetical protein EV702DRAFT_1050866 [Suillus placidus]
MYVLRTLSRRSSSSNEFSAFGLQDLVLRLPSPVGTLAPLCIQLMVIPSLNTRSGRRVLFVGNMPVSVKKFDAAIVPYYVLISTVENLGCKCPKTSEDEYQMSHIKYNTNTIDEDNTQLPRHNYHHWNKGKMGSEMYASRNMPQTVMGGFCAHVGRQFSCFSVVMNLSPCYPIYAIAIFGLLLSATALARSPFSQLLSNDDTGTICVWLHMHLQAHFNRAELFQPTSAVMLSDEKELVTRRKKPCTSHGEAGPAGVIASPVPSVIQLPSGQANTSTASKPLQGTTSVLNLLLHDVGGVAPDFKGGENEGDDMSLAQR